MNKTNLPILTIKDIILLPHNELRLEIIKEEDKALISLASSYYNKNILIINQTDEYKIDKNNYPEIGIIGFISMKIDLPNKKTKLVIEGLERVKIEEVFEENNTLIASVIPFNLPKLEYFEEIAYKRTLFKNLTDFLNNNDINIDTNKINENRDLEYLTDILVDVLNLSDTRKIEYLKEIDPTNRVIMLLDDISAEEKISILESEIEAKVSKNIEDSQKEFLLQEKLKVIKEELGLEKETETLELNEKIKAIKAPKKIKDKLYKELRKYENTPNTSPEYSMIRTYIDTLISLPWSYKTIDNSDLSEALYELNKTHYGLDDIKERIIEELALMKKTNNEVMPIICLVGPPGVGKSTLAKSIANAMKRKYVKISVGGVNDPSEIVGHRRTYIGSSPGRIIESMIKAGTINPLIVIDEIDKMTKDIKGDPSSSLLEALDKEQNKRFYDNYIEEEYDLSKVMFICTANYIENIPIELLDRLEIIELESYTEYEKLNIAKSHIIPKLINTYKLTNEIVFEDNAILKIISSYTKESGVRELERLIAKILRKIVKEQEIKKETNKYIINTREIEKYLGIEKYTFNSLSLEKVGLVNGLYYSIYGGDILKIESTYYKGNGKLVLTGSLGDVFKESATIALSYIKSNCEDLKIDFKVFEENDFHIHVPENAIKKEGPSAGIAITTALISSIKNKKIPNNISMTGEITLNGDILPIGGLKEKIIGAKRAGIKKIYIPSQNKKDLEEIDEILKKDLNFVLVDNYKEIIKELKL